MAEEVRIWGVLQFQRQVDGSGDGVEDVGLDRFEAQGFVERDGCGHGGNGIEADARVACRTRFFADAFSQPAAKLFSACLWPNVEALHFAGNTFKGAQGYAAERFGAAPGEQEPALGQVILTGQAGKFSFEILEAEIDVQTRGVFAEEAAHSLKVLRDFGGSYFGHGLSLRVALLECGREAAAFPGLALAHETQVESGSFAAALQKQASPAVCLVRR